jgi:hypothetical protein
MKWISAITLSSLALCFCACKPGASSKTIPNTSTTATPVTNAHELEGKWVGRARCGSFTLDIVLDLKNPSLEKIEAIVTINTPSVPTGIYRLHGDYKNGKLDLNTNGTMDWIKRPGSAGMISLSGKIDLNSYQGKLVECMQPFSFSRKLEVKNTAHP